MRRKKRNAHSTRLLLMVIAVFFAAVVILLLLTFLKKQSAIRYSMNPLRELSCRDLDESVEHFIQTSKYCTQDSDCVVIDQGLRQCECFTVANKNADFSQISSSVEKLNAQCKKDIVCKTCNPKPSQDQIVCRNNTCSYVAGTYMRTTTYIYSPSDNITMSFFNNGKSDIWIKNYCTTPLLLVPVTAGLTDTFNLILPNSNKEIECSMPIATPVNLSETMELSSSLAAYGTIEPGIYKMMVYYSIVDPTKAGQKIQYFEAYSNEFEIKDNNYSIITNKLSYQPNEPVQATITNLQNSSIWIPRCAIPYILSKKSHEGDWISYGPYPTRNCKGKPLFLLPNESEEFNVDIKSVYGIDLQQGTYRFMVQYSFINPDLPSRESIQYNSVYSNEFEIKNNNLEQKIYLYESCADIYYQCQEGYQAFVDEKGCGCELMQ